jgi:peptidoglycan/LPS O-acetylase OafA/YrhL
MDMPLAPDLGVATSTRPRAHGKIADIEALRGIAILFVIATHLQGPLLSWPIPWLGHVTAWYFRLASGVDLFFAISGFVIARSLIPSLQAARDRHELQVVVLSFWIRRAWRLLPSAWLWLAITLAAAAWFNRSRHFGLLHDNFESTVAAVLTLANVHFAMAYGHFGLGASAPYWSLSLEEQFYFALPLVAFAAGRRLTATLLLILAIACVVPEDSLLCACFRIQPILLGVLLADFARRPAWRMAEPVGLAGSRLARAACLIVPLLLIGALGAVQQRIVPFPYDAIGVLCAALVFVASYDRNYTCADGRMKQTLIWFGSRSYGLYLIHTPAFDATHEFFYRICPPGTVFDHRFAVTFLVAGLGSMLLLAELNYRLLEQPLRRRGQRIARGFEARWRMPAGLRAPSA